MSSKTLNTRIRQRIDTTANWNTNNSTILADGEIGFERTTNGNIKIKIGDGLTSWANLNYVSTGNGEQASNVSVKILQEIFYQSVDEYTISNNTFPNQTISIYNTFLSEETAITLMSLIEAEGLVCYLNSLETELAPYIFEDPTLIGLGENDTCYSFAYNFDLETFTAKNNILPYYIINIIYFNTQNYYVFQFITNLPPQTAPTDLILYLSNNVQLNENNNFGILIDNTVKQNSSGLITSSGVYTAIKNISKNLILEEKFSYTIDEYATSENIFPSQTVSFQQDTTISNAEATKIINLIEDENATYYLNSSNIKLLPYIFEDPTLIGLQANDACYTLNYNFDLVQFAPLDNTKPYYVINLIYLNSTNTYMLQVLTNLTPQNAPNKWTIYQSKENDIFIDNSINQNSNNLITNKAIYNALANFATVATSGDYNDLSNKPTLFSGSYNDLSNKPTIPTDTGDLTNNAGYITSSALTINNIDVGDYLIISGGNASSFTLT